jgi:hypothetical protein
MSISPANQALPRANLGPAIPLEELMARPKTIAGAEPPARIAPAPQEELALESAVTWPEPLPGTSFETGFGGVFYLVNLALFLGLYADFTRPRTPGIDLPLWDFLALVGGALAGPGLEDDPLWGWLAKLAGRAAEQDPGRDFLPPAEWRMPPDWLEPFEGPGKWTWSMRAGSLQVDHPAGFRVVDVLAATDGLSLQLEDEIRPYQRFIHALKHRKPKPSGRQPEAVFPSVDAWLSWLLPYIRERLQLALGLDDSGDPGGLLCSRQAHIYLTESHLDVTFSLSNLPIEIRRSGLDRNPGWVPAAHRYVVFRYED